MSISATSCRTRATLLDAARSSISKQNPGVFFFCLSCTKVLNRDEIAVMIECSDCRILIHPVSSVSQPTSGSKLLRPFISSRSFHGGSFRVNRAFSLVSADFSLSSVLQRKKTERIRIRNGGSLSCGQQATFLTASWSARATANDVAMGPVHISRHSQAQPHRHASSQRRSEQQAVKHAPTS